ncbi:hypothetical protein GCM10017559_46770 [Streptosporangium longisporum]|uniref:Transposase IS4-like domain-containing protein n=1 Tax=Streptosporangium longisporum TaxID=46187 RepID=A0ABN3Y3Z6_9ACTN
MPATGQGYDAGKKIAGRKRNIVTDTLGLLIAVMVTAANFSDGAPGLPLLIVAPATPIKIEYGMPTMVDPIAGPRPCAIDHHRRRAG